MTAAAGSQATGRAWARSLLLVIPLLAAVFLMHGVQCGGDDHGTDHTLMALGAPESGGMVHAAVPRASGTAHAAADAPNDPSPPLSAAGVCLALLTAGLVLFLVTLRLPRRPAPDDDPGGSSRAVPSAPPARPPSLAELCLLRI